MKRERMDAAPLISIILPTFNCAGCLPHALESLAVQTARDFEVVASDGASSDATLDILESFRSKLPELTVLSRRDLGIYDAINRAILACRGLWIFVLGSDDRLHSAETLAQVGHELRLTDSSFVYGDVRVMGVNSMVADGGRYGGVFTLTRLLEHNICHQAVFAHRDLFVRLGLYDLRYRIWADWDFAQRAFVSERTQWIDLIVADYAATGTSSGSGDGVFLARRFRRLLALWWARPLSLVVLHAVLQRVYWDALKSRRALKT